MQQGNVIHAQQGRQVKYYVHALFLVFPSSFSYGVKITRRHQDVTIMSYSVSSYIKKTQTAGI